MYYQEHYSRQNWPKQQIWQLHWGGGEHYSTLPHNQKIVILMWLCLRVFKLSMKNIHTINMATTYQL